MRHDEQQNNLGYPSRKLREECLNAIHSPVGPGIVIFKVKGTWRGQKRKRLCGRRSPLGDILDEECPGVLTCAFDAQEILDWLEGLQRTA